MSEADPAPAPAAPFPDALLHAVAALPGPAHPSNFIMPFLDWVNKSQARETTAKVLSLIHI